MFNFSFRSIGDEKDVARVLDSMILQPFSYPNYMDWVYQIARADLLGGWKKGIMFLDESEGVLVGHLIYQPHKTERRILEAKHARVHPKVEGRFGMAFMFRQMEFEAQGKFQGVKCDVHANNFRIRRFLEFMGYKEIFRGEIYTRNSEEIGYEKNLNP